MAHDKITITDGWLARQIYTEQARRGDAMPAKTARNLLIERLAQIEDINRLAVAVAPSEPAPPIDTGFVTSDQPTED